MMSTPPHQPAPSACAGWPKCVKASGLRVQKSVFEVVCTRAQFPTLRQRLIDEIDTKLDSIRIYQLKEGTLRTVDVLGIGQPGAHFGDHII